MRLDELPLVGGLIALRVERWVDGVYKRGLDAMVPLEVGKEAVIRSEFFIQTGGDELLGQVVLGVALEGVGIGSSVVWRGRRCTGGVVIEGEELIVERHLRGLASGIEVGDRRAFIGGVGNDHLGGYRCDKAQSFVVHEEEHLVFDNRAANRGSSLVGIGVGLWRSCEVVEPLVGVQVAVGPVVGHVSMELVGSGAGEDIFLNAAQAAILGAIGIGHNVDLVDVIGTEQQVAGTGVVQVEEGIVFFSAVNGEII